MIVLKNKGEIELEVIKTMGVNVKDIDNPIGYFGTGLKYAIAIFLREEIDFQLYIGENKYLFATEEKIIRGKTFKLCKMLGPYDVTELGFTTDLGKNWKIWQAYRELESNCRDEGGSVSNKLKPEPGFTSIAINTEINTKTIFIDKIKRKLLLRNKDIEIFEGESDFMYYKGIRAKDLNRPTIYTYNILKRISLTEDRLLSYTFEVDTIINNAIAEMNNKEVIKNVVTAPKNNYESTLCQSHYTDVAPKESFKEVCSNNKVNSSVSEYIKKHEPKPDKTPLDIAKEFRQQLDDFCTSFNLNYEVDRDGYVTIMANEILKHEEP